MLCESCVDYVWLFLVDGLECGVDYYYLVGSGDGLVYVCLVDEVVVVGYYDVVFWEEFGDVLCC